MAAPGGRCGSLAAARRSSPRGPPGLSALVTEVSGDVTEVSGELMALPVAQLWVGAKNLQGLRALDRLWRRGVRGLDERELLVECGEPLWLREAEVDALVGVAHDVVQAVLVGIAQRVLKGLSDRRV